MTGVQPKKNLAVFISGQGSNLEVILNQKQAFQSVLVVSSRKEAYGLTRAKNHQVPSIVLEPKIDWSQLNSQLKAHQIDLIFLAGFMKIVPPDFVSSWQDRIFNLHPSWLPEFKGLKAIERAYEQKVGVGVTIHAVSSELDSGPILLQEWAVTRDEIAGLTLQEVIERTHQREHQLVSRWVELFS